MAHTDRHDTIDHWWQMPTSSILSYIQRAEKERVPKHEIITQLQNRGASESRISAMYSQFYKDEGFREITFNQRPLGFNVIMDTRHKNAHLSSLKDQFEIDAHALGLTVGAKIYAINDNRVDGQRHSKIRDMLLAQSLPFTVRFKKGSPTDEAVVHHHNAQKRQREKDTIAIYGYCRQIMCAYMLNIPVEIVQICFGFYRSFMDFEVGQTVDVRVRRNNWCHAVILRWKKRSEAIAASEEMSLSSKQKSYIAKHGMEFEAVLVRMSGGAHAEIWIFRTIRRSEYNMICACEQKCVLNDHLIAKTGSQTQYTE